MWMDKEKYKMEDRSSYLKYDTGIVSSIQYE